MNNQSAKDAITPAKICRMKFRIPLYQRPYSWEEKQVKQLLEDLFEARTTKNHYYVGILSVAKTQDDPDRYDLIDGQQRITTLMLIGKAALSLENCAGDWQYFLTEKRLQLYGRKYNQEFLDSGIGHGIENFSKITKNMIRAFETAQNYFKAHEEESREFSKYIYENAAFFISEVPPEYSLLDKNQQFVRMNNRGKQLEKHEILKVRLTKREGFKEKEKLLSVWNDMLGYLVGIKKVSTESNTLEDILKDNSNVKDPNSSEKVELFYKPIVTIPEFLLIALDRSKKWVSNVSFDPEKLIETFDRLTDPNDISGFIDILKNQLDILRNYFIYISYEGNKVQYKFASKDDRNGRDAYQEKFSDGDACKNHLKTVQSYLYVSTEPHHWLVPAFDWFQEKKTAISAKEFITELERIDNNLISQQKRNLTSNRTLKEMQYGNISFYWFYRLDYELWKSYQAYKKNKDKEPLWAKIDKEDRKVKNLFDNFRFRRCSSVEHINPRHPIEGDPIEGIDSFGNLALISGSRNSKFSNNSPAGKRDIILNSDYTESLKMAHFLWGSEGDVKKAGETMHGILLKA